MPLLNITLKVEGLILSPNRTKPWPKLLHSESMICFTSEARNLEAMKLNFSERKLKSVKMFILGNSV
jgi:hypothetical protein